MKLIVKRLGFLALIIAFTFIVAMAFYAYEPQRSRVDCEPVLANSMGEFKGLARVDSDGYVYPIGNLQVDDKVTWKMKFYFYDDISSTTDYSDVERFKKIKFYCSGGDSGTPEVSVVIYKSGVLVYRTGIEGYGLQNREVGFAPAYNKLDVWIFLVKLSLNFREEENGRENRKMGAD